MPGDESTGCVPIPLEYLRLPVETELGHEPLECSLGAGGELRVWYFTTSAGKELWGGQLSAHIFAEVACLVSARGQLALTLEQILGDTQTSPPPGA